MGRALSVLRSPLSVGGRAADNGERPTDNGQRRTNQGARVTPRPSTAAAVINRFPRVRVLVAGDLMLDHFIWGTVERISPEAPVPVVQVTAESRRLGGAANVIHNLRALGGQVTACGVVGADAPGRQLVEDLRRLGADVTGVAQS